MAPKSKKKKTPQVIEAVIVTPKKKTPEEKAYAALRAAGVIPANVEQAPGLIVRTRRGKTLFREPGRRGADLSEPPLALEYKKLVRKMQTDENKNERALRAKFNAEAASKVAADKRRQTGEETAKQVITLHHEGKRAAQISKRVHLSASQVRKILTAHRR